MRVPVRQLADFADFLQAKNFKQMQLVEIKEYEVKDSIESLIADCKPHLSMDDIDRIIKAFNLAYERIGGLKWVDGEKILNHSIEVARIAFKEIGLGAESVISALLHNLKDPSLPEGTLPKNLEKDFGVTVIDIMEGLTKINAINTENIALHSENFRRLLLALSGDVRVILLKIADQLRDMRALEKRTMEEQLRIARETNYLYAPIAHRLGLYAVKTELEDIALKYLHPEDYNYIVKKLEETDVQRHNFVAKFVKPIEEKLRQRGFDFEMKARTKSIHSLWNKIRNKKVDFEDVYDIFAIRVILNSKPEEEKSDCWQVYSIVTEEYQPNPDRLRDWISIPKSNGYESLHTTVMGPEGKWVEVQIRTQRMDEVAEKGFAAHWKYKGGKGSQELDHWLATIREILENPELNPVDFIDDFKRNIYEDEIFVFTPKGDLKKLPAGSTMLDFAYEIHSDLGDHCTGGKVNGRMVTIRQKLKNGDSISIETNNNQKPKLDWLDFVATSKAKSRIKSSINEEKSRLAQLGKETLIRKCKNWKIDFNDDLIRTLLKHFKIKLAQDLYAKIAEGEIDPLSVKVLLAKEEEKVSPKDQLQEFFSSETIEEFSFGGKDDFLVIDNNLNNVNYKLAKCCQPIFGDEIFGFVTIKEGIKIHRKNCPNANQMFERYPYRVIKAKWQSTQNRNSFQATLHISGTNDMGLISKISHVISKDVGVQMRSINVNNDEGAFDGTLRLLVNDLEHLEFVIHKLKNIKGVISVIRSIT